MKRSPRKVSHQEIILKTSAFIAALVTFIFCMKGPCLAADPAADAIYYQGTVLTVDLAMNEAEAAAVKDGQILAVGSRVEVFKYRSGTTRMIDLGGKT